ncbi:MAG TPA: DUF6600 domain-containing protein [Candidatus Acidoferrum sp.]|nr:DUF6600 domain-containing protein [Candidatus Acidoferrum sp.]
MTSKIAFRSLLSLATFAMLVSASVAMADNSHARIIRLSLVQGDVRIAHNVNGDPLQSPDNQWELASLNLPVHQGDALATDNGRAEVEFESGNIAFLAENTVLEFYDLSLEDGSFTTRLIVRQGSASFYVRPEHGDYFSVTGGDFSVEASGKGYFRLNNYDDGSDVQVLQGHVSVLTKDKTTPLSKGQSLSMKASDTSAISVENAANSDDFDQWVSGRIASGQAALTASQQYSGVYDYTSGFGDLYTFGGWYSVNGFGYCWRPYGVSFGWNPFQFGHWFFDPAFGNWVFVGGQPWGWLPYHYGSWLFQPGLGWVWTPTGSFPHTRTGSFAHARTTAWRAVTATWVRNGSQVGLVPAHPLDERGKTPTNLSEGIFPVSQRGVLDRVQLADGEKWKSFKNSSRDSLPIETSTAAPPARVVRTMAGGGSSSGVAIAASTRESGIVFDPAEHRFVNSASTSSTSTDGTQRGGVGNRTEANTSGREMPTGRAGASTSDLRRGNETSGTRGSATTTRSSLPPSARTSAMPPVPRPSASGERTGGSAGTNGGSRWGGSSSGSSSGSTRTWSGGSPSSSASAGSSHPSSSSSGGRPH